MADKEEEFRFETDFPSSNRSPASNDPWTTPPSESNSIPKLSSVPTDPLRNIISSEMYIESLEKKLTRLKGKQKGNLKASDMISSLQDVKSSQMTQILTGSSDAEYCDEDSVDSSSVTSSIQRKLNPERQALNTQELLPLVNNDVLAKVSEQCDGDTASKEVT